MVGQEEDEELVKPLILGEAPGRGKDWVGGMFPLSGQVGVTLCRFAGLEAEALREKPGDSRHGHYYWTLLKRFDCQNVLDYWPGQNGRGSAFPIVEAEEALSEIEQDLMARPAVVLLGRRLVDLFRLEPRAFFEWSKWPNARHGTWVAAIPHPSGLTRNYNDPEQRQKAGVVMRQAMSRAG